MERDISFRGKGGMDGQVALTEARMRFGCDVPYETQC